MKLHVNNVEYLIMVSDDSLDQFKTVTERSHLDMQQSLIAMGIRKGALPLGAYPIGVIDWEGSYVVLYAESGFPMSALERMMKRIDAWMTLLGVSEDDIVVCDHTPTQLDDDPDFDGEGIVLRTIFGALDDRANLTN